MSIWWIILIVIGGLILLGPIMYGFAKLNHVKPFILEEDNPSDDINSFILVNILRPLFVPLWLEVKFLRWLKLKIRSPFSI